MTPFVFNWTREPSLQSKADANVVVSQSVNLQLLDLQRNHWRKLHTTRMTAEQLEEWVLSIPGCASCRKDFLRILHAHPPIYDDWEKWTWTVHNVVNTKLGKQLIAWTDAIELWGWPIKDIPSNGTAENAGKNTS